MLRQVFWMSGQAASARFTAPMPFPERLWTDRIAHSILKTPCTSLKCFIWYDFVLENSPNYSADTTIRAGGGELGEFQCWSEASGPASRAIE